MAVKKNDREGHTEACPEQDLIHHLEELKDQISYTISG